MSGPSYAMATTAKPAGHRLRLAIGRAGGVVTVSVHGDLTGDSGGGVEHILHDLICEQGNLHVVVDAKGLLHADTDGVSVLVNACRLAHQCGAILTVRNASEAVRWVLDEWSVDEHVTATDSAGPHLASI